MSAPLRSAVATNGANSGAAPALSRKPTLSVVTSAASAGNKLQKLALQRSAAQLPTGMPGSPGGGGGGGSRSRNASTIDRPGSPSTSFFGSKSNNPQSPRSARSQSQKNEQRASSPTPAKARAERASVTAQSMQKEQELDPYLVTETDYYLYKDNARRYWDEQDKNLLRPSSKQRNRPISASQQRQPQKQTLPQPQTRAASVAPTMSHDPFSFSDIISSQVNSKTSQMAVRTRLDELEERQQNEELQRVMRKTKARTLWDISEGTSTLSNKPPNVSYFMNDFDRYIKSDTLISSRPTSAISTARRTARDQPLSSIRAASTTTTTRLQPTTPSAAATRAQQMHLADRFMPQISIQQPSAVLGASSYAQPATQISDSPTAVDSTWRTYTTNPAGRSVRSIYHPITKQPSQVLNFVSKSAVTNESLYSYITTEVVEEIDLEHCNWISNAILESIGQFCQQLTVLNLQGCLQLRDRTLAVIASGCPNITNLNVGTCSLVTDEGLQEIFIHCFKLRVLSIHSCPRISGISFQFIKLCDKIEVLDVSYCDNLTDLPLLFVSEYCPLLMRLDCSGCRQVTDEGILAICSHCEHLETLQLMLCGQEGRLTGESLGQITRSTCGRSLRVLDLTGLRQLTDEAAIKVAEFGDNLEFLGLNGCVNLTDKSLMEVAMFCRNLKCLEIAQCRGLTLQAMIELVHSTQNTLNKFVITECNISDSELDILKQVSQQCIIIKHKHEAPAAQHYVAYLKPPKAGKKKKGTGKKKKGKSK